MTKFARYQLMAADSISTAEIDERQMMELKKQPAKDVCDIGRMEVKRRKETRNVPALRSCLIKNPKNTTFHRKIRCNTKHQTLDICSDVPPTKKLKNPEKLKAARTPVRENIHTSKLVSHVYTVFLFQRRIARSNSAPAIPTMSLWATGRAKKSLMEAEEDEKELEKEKNRPIPSDLPEIVREELIRRKESKNKTPGRPCLIEKSKNQRRIKVDMEHKVVEINQDTNPSKNLKKIWESDLI